MNKNALDFLQPGGALSSRLFARLTNTEGQHEADLGETLTPSTLVGPWQIKSVIGRGGTSTVYLAERADGEFDLEVALKVVRPGVALNDRLRHERQILGGLRHPGIARLIDGGELPNGQLWLAMEPVIGQRIDHYANEHHLDWHARAALFDAVCDAVGYAHRQLLVHRDIKPSNIIVDEHGRPRLLDFGIALIDTPVTGQTDRALTPGYASPEQLAGNPVTTVSDIFQLGLLLQRLLAAPGSGKYGFLPMPRRVAADLTLLLAHALADSPAERYPSVVELRADLQAILACRPLSIQRGRWPRTLRFVERNRLPLALASSGILALLTLGLFSIYTFRQERDAAQRAAAQAQATTDFLVGLFRVSDPEENRGARLSANDILAAGAERIDQELAGQPELRANLGLTIGEVYRSLGENARAVEVLEHQLEAAREALPSHSAQRARLAASLGWVRYIQGKHEQAAELYNEAELALPEDTKERARLEMMLANRRGTLLRRLGRYEEARISMERAVALSTELFGLDYVDTAGALNNLALLYRDMRRLEEAEAALRQARAIYIKLFGYDHQSVFGSSDNLSTILMSLGRYQEARTYIETSLAGERRIYGKAHPNIAGTFDNLARIDFYQGRYTDCIAAAQESRAMFAQTLGSRHPYTAAPMAREAQCQLALQHPEAALSLFTEAHGIRVQAQGPNHPDALLNLRGMGMAQLALGDVKRAEQTLREALKLERERSPNDPLTLPETLVDLSEVLQARGDRAEWPALLKEAETVLATAPVSGDHRRIQEKLETQREGKTG